ncbi:MAG: two-component sensor histidine kinase [Planctomycetota bacterium]|nr:HAMP domain-containing protein [Anaerolineales bacterium]GIK53488.1 MAG: two-component sensor histidine kinase [Planctomycetota bacterium]
MNIIRRHLGWKLFLSYLVVIVVGVVSLALTAELQTPAAIDRHMAQMATMMGGTGMMTDLTESFSRAVNEVLLVAASLAVVTAVLVSTFVTRRIVKPVQAMKAASQRIAGGRYDERVQVTGEDELSELGRSFNRMAHELARTEERRRQLIGDVAHELRTPLSSIKSVMEGLQDGVLPAEPQTFANVEQEVNRLQRLVRDLEELSRAEAGQIRLEKEWVDPAALVETAVSRLRPQFADKQVSLESRCPPTLPTIHVDPARMMQVLLNLLGNALQYTPSGGRVTVQCSVNSEHSSANGLPANSLPHTAPSLQISIKDSGIGLTADQLAHIFERFYRVDKSRSRAGGGSGIGLTISKHLVEAHNGRLIASSSGVNQGSTFTVILPVSSPPEP